MPLRIAGLRHEARDHAVELEAVVEALLGELLDPLDVLGREIGPQLDRARLPVLSSMTRVFRRIGRPGCAEQAAPATTQNARARQVRRIARRSIPLIVVLASQRQRPPRRRRHLLWLCGRACNSQRELASSLSRYLRGLAFAFRRFATAGETNSETSPPISAIWRTRVPVMWRTCGAGGEEHGLDAGRHGAVHAGHLHLVVEVGAVAQAAEDDASRLRPAAASTVRLAKVTISISRAGRAARSACVSRLQHLDALVGA